MRKVAIIFLCAVIVPSGALAWLALRSLHDEQLVLRARQTQLYQAVADSFVRQTEGYIIERQREFANTVDTLLAATPVNELAHTFDERIRAAWPFAEVGFALALNGEVTSPNMLGRTEGRRFRVENDKWLCSRESIEVYVSTVKGSVNLKVLDEATGDAEKADPGKIAVLKGKQRAVAPAEGVNKDTSKVAVAETDFRQIVGNQNEGIVARFLQDKLHVMLWHRSARDENTVFGAQLDLQRVKAALRRMVETLEPPLRNELCVAALDENGRPVAISVPGFVADWKHPLAASEIGETLPHWEMAVYALNPARLDSAAASLKWTVGLSIAGLITAIAIGGLLLMLDKRRQMELVRQKTDFVSNVSHELKTPLTSIRMFSELLAEGRVHDEAKTKAYLKIITAETSRLTRLINNILDFARMEKGEKKYRFESCDLAKIAADAIDNYRTQLEEHGFTIETAFSNESAKVRGDCDALSQIILNLLSNAEKYSGETKQIRIEVVRDDKTISIKVMDRGLGVPSGADEKIFEQFYRAHDSLSSGIQGSGLGLTLSRQIARAHGGDVIYEPRKGRGSVFTLRIPAEDSK